MLFLLLIFYFFVVKECSPCNLNSTETLSYPCRKFHWVSPQNSHYLCFSEETCQWNWWPSASSRNTNQMALRFLKIFRRWPGEESIEYLPVSPHPKLESAPPMRMKPVVSGLQPGLKEKAGMAKGSPGNCSARWRAILLLGAGA